MQKLFKYSENVFGVVNENPVNIGDTFTSGSDKEGKPIVSEITEVIECRKERGKYENEEKRRYWAKVASRVTVNTIA